MMYLTLTEQPATDGPACVLGTVEIRVERVDSRKNVASYSLHCQGHEVGMVHGWRQWPGPWRLAQAALNAIYGGTTIPLDLKRKDDGQCNELTTKGQRCRLDAQPGSYFCVGHDRLH